MKKLLFFYLFFQISTYCLVKTNPYDQVLPTPTHELKLRVIEHGNSSSSVDLDRLVKASEVIFSQCNDLSIKINLTSTLNLSQTRLHEQMSIMKKPPYQLTQDYYDFFSPFMEKEDSKIIDVHIVDFITSKDRQRFDPNGLVQIATIGKAYPQFIMDYLFRDLRYNESIKPSLVSQNSLFLAAKPIQLKLKQIQKRKVGNKLVRVRPTVSTLLAHELGHILVETQRPSIENDLFMDHHCGDDYCDYDNLMVAGGYDALEYSNQLFSPLPKLNPAQCEALKNNPLLEKLF